MGNVLSLFAIFHLLVWLCCQQASVVCKQDPGGVCQLMPTGRGQGKRDISLPTSQSKSESEMKDEMHLDMFLFALENVNVCGT